MKQIRVGVFETNSSSTHSLTIVSEEDYEKWVDGDLLYHRYDENLVPVPEDYEAQKEAGEEDETLLTFGDFCNIEKESFYQHFTTKSGDKMVAFGNYGYDG